MAILTIFQPNPTRFSLSVKFRHDFVTNLHFHDRYMLNMRFFVLTIPPEASKIVDEEKIVLHILSRHVTLKEGPPHADGRKAEKDTGAAA
ncbi:MAG: hypothetical protein MJ136_06955 [Clostridia bacterium]|nr:hypothetical protein [Clostridia bacterium]